MVGSFYRPGSIWHCHTLSLQELKQKWIISAIEARFSQSLFSWLVQNVLMKLCGRKNSPIGRLIKDEMLHANQSTLAIFKANIQMSPIL